MAFLLVFNLKEEAAWAKTEVLSSNICLLSFLFTYAHITNVHTVRLKEPF